MTKILVFKIISRKSIDIYVTDVTISNVTSVTFKGGVYVGRTKNIGCRVAGDAGFVG